MDSSDFNIVTKHCKKIETILIIEDSISLATHLQEQLETILNFSCDIAHTENEAKNKIASKQYDLVINDLHLPDTTSEFMSYLIESGLRVIIITGNENNEKRSKILAYPIVDYVLKSDAKSLVQYLVKTIKRLNQNRFSVIGICDDSKFSREVMIQLIKPQNLSYIEFNNGEEAYQAINKYHVTVDMLLTDYLMPKMDGLELIRHLRHELSSDNLPIICISASNKPNILVQFLKTGASDYIKKPFENEEFLVRLNITLDQLYMRHHNLELIKQLQQANSYDFMTQLYNRNHYFSIIDHITSNAIRNNLPYGMLMIDIDYFKKINDTYGHHTGDIAIQHVSGLLKQITRTSDYCFRWGGEEFLILIPFSTAQELFNFAERIRQAVENSPLYVENLHLTLDITVSIGGTISMDDKSERVISKSDEMLYESKKAGRNCVRISQ